MRALTVRQPWAWAIIHGQKDVENRTRNLAGSYRGPVAIHAGLIEDEAAYDDEMIREALGRYDDGWVLAEQVGTVGAFIGVVDLVDVHDAWPGYEVTNLAGEVDRSERCCESPWGEMPADFGDRLVHLVVANPRPLVEPVPAKGRLGLWTPTAEQQLAIVERIGHAA